MTRDDIDTAVADFARRQHGAFAGRQVRALGGSYALVRRRVEAGRWLELDHRVYALPGNPATWLRQVKAAELGHPRAIVSGSTAAVLHRISGIRPGRVEVTVPSGTSHRSTLAQVRRRDALAIAEVDGIKTVDLVQALVDLSAVVAGPLLLRATEDVLRRSGVEADRVASRVIEAGARRIPGAAKLRAAVEALLGGEPPAESELELRLRRAIDCAGLRPVHYQASAPWWTAAPQRLDALAPEHLVIVEADGRRWHTRVADFERDRERDNAAAAHGYRVVRLTWTMLTVGLPATLRLLRSLRRAPDEMRAQSVGF